MVADLSGTGAAGARVLQQGRERKCNVNRNKPGSRRSQGVVRLVWRLRAPLGGKVQVAQGVHAQDRCRRDAPLPNAL